MKKLFFVTLLLALVIAGSIPTMARADVSVSIGIGLPPIVFPAPPALIVLPDTYVYVAPEIDVDLFFWNGWWWRLWEDRWYRSHYYDRGWRLYHRVPSFYFDVDPGWRGYYRDRNWYGHQWNYERIPHQRLLSNWRNWEYNRHWERRGTWGVQSYQSRPQKQREQLRHQRQQQYQQRPEIIQQQRRQPREEVRQSQRQEQRQPLIQQPKQQPQKKVKRQQKGPQGKPERGEKEKRDRR